jgi:hypothetical protein
VVPEDKVMETDHGVVWCGVVWCGVGVTNTRTDSPVQTPCGVTVSHRIHASTFEGGAYPAL